MPYKKFHLYLPVGENFNLEKSIRIFNRFLDGLENNDIEYPNFNHYPKPQNHLTFRAEMNDVTYETATHIAETLRDEHEIHRFERGEANPPPYVKSAHELASRWAIEINNNRVHYTQEIQKPIGFLMYFFKFSLEKIGYDFYITWDIEREYLGEVNQHKARIETIVNSCEGYLNEKKEDFKNPDFLERFIHLFMNCTLIQGILIKKSYIEIENNQQRVREFYLPCEDEFWRHFTIANSLKWISKSISDGD